MVRAHVILNSRAGRLIDGDVHRTMRTIEGRLKQAGWSVSAACPAPGELEAHLRGLDPTLDVVVAAGGDGTLAGVGACLAGRRTALAVLPLGTLNVLADDLGVPVALDEALDVAVSGRTAAVDAATVNGRVFFIQAVLGVAAELAERREKMRGAGSVAAWAELATGMATDLLASTPVRYQVNTGRRRTTIITRTLIISNNRLKNRHRLLPYRRTLSGQVMALYALRGKGLITAMRFAAEALLPRGKSAAVRELVADRIVVNADIKEGRALIDGEIASIDFPATFETVPRALNVIVPQR
ncbi:MAG: diacylglycerol/lipid kinase family protein [Alphaproteobacteria bacterium]